MTLSPRPWGWTEDANDLADFLEVVPTPVGMDRNIIEPARRPLRCPHARGDGPLWAVISADIHRLSPRPWGWTAVVVTSSGTLNVVPTPVGMDREPSIRQWTRRSCPHARGDGPRCASGIRRRGSLSPRPWGWTGRGSAHCRERIVVPTPVGMDRGARRRPAQDGVVPTPVGMDRHATDNQHASASCPHARGDGPASSAREGGESPLSPRPWGWTGDPVGGAGTRDGRDAVVPTPVGMDRKMEDIRNRVAPLSPRPWGWTVL